MAYYPQSQIKIKKSLGKEFEYKDNNNPFAGTYIETSDGLFFEGSSVVDLGREIKKTEKSQYLNNEDVIVQYNRLNLNSFNYMKKRIPFTSSRPLPTEQDYELGYFTRYFVKKANENIFFEINKKLFDDIAGKKGNPDYNLYVPGYIRWTLRDNTNVGDQAITNRKNLKRLEKRFPQITGFFSNLSEHKEVKNNLFTFGDELYYSDGKEYIGPYHVHPEKGPMEGSKHTDSPHRKLYWRTYTRVRPKTPGQYWKYKEGSGPYAGYGPNHMTVFFTNEEGQTRDFSSEDEYFVHRDVNGYPSDYSDVKEYDKGVYWTDKADPKNYESYGKPNQTFIWDIGAKRLLYVDRPFTSLGTIYYSANPSFGGQSREVLFETAEEYFNHRQINGYPADFTQILIKDPSRGDRALMEGLGNAVVDAFETQTGIDLFEAAATAELEGITLEEYIQNALGTTPTQGVTPTQTPTSQPTSTPSTPSTPSYSSGGGGGMSSGGGGGASSGGGGGGY